MSDSTEKEGGRQLLHLVFGGRLTNPRGVEFEDISKLDIVGIFPNYKEAYDAWKAASQKSVDDAHVRYFVVHLHRFMDPYMRKQTSPAEAAVGPAATREAPSN